MFSLKDLFSPYKRGDVIYAQRENYRHYGIYTGNKQVVHYANKKAGIFGAVIEETPLEDFAKGDKVYVRRFSGKRLFSPPKTVERARGEVGKRNYNLLFNNCEHFALWCKTGRAQSDQVREAFEQIGFETEPRDILEDFGVKFLEAVVEPALEAFVDGINKFQEGAARVDEVLQGVTERLEEWAKEET